MRRSAQVRAGLYFSGRLRIKMKKDGDSNGSTDKGRQADAGKHSPCPFQGAHRFALACVSAKGRHSFL